LINIKKWSSLGLKVFMHLGSWDNETEWSYEKFSNFMKIPSTQKELVTSIILQMKNIKFDGVLFSWTYPGCPRVKTDFFL
jgi:GH18 family chitinase